MVISRLIITTLTTKPDHYSGRFEFRLVESIFAPEREMAVKRKAKSKRSEKRKRATETTTMTMTTPTTSQVAAA